MRMRTSNVALMAVSLGIVGAVLGGIRALRGAAAFRVARHDDGTCPGDGRSGELDRALRRRSNERRNPHSAPVRFRVPISPSR